MAAETAASRAKPETFRWQLTRLINWLRQTKKKEEKTKRTETRTTGQWNITEHGHETVVKSQNCPRIHGTHTLASSSCHVTCPGLWHEECHTQHTTFNRIRIRSQTIPAPKWQWQKLPPPGFVFLILISRNRRPQQVGKSLSDLGSSIWYSLMRFYANV